MNRASESAYSFIRTLTSVAERLASHDIVVGNLSCDWATFGSWILQATKGAEEELRYDAIRNNELSKTGPLTFRVTWDGRDRELHIENTIPTSVLSGPVNWTNQLQERFESEENALAFVEDYLIKRIS